MLEIKILVDNVDYDAMPDVLVPLVAEKLKEEKKGGILLGVLAQNPGMTASIAKTVLGKMSQDKKNALVTQMVGKHREKILDKGRDLLAKHQIHLDLCDISIREM